MARVAELDRATYDRSFCSFPCSPRFLILTTSSQPENHIMSSTTKTYSNLIQANRPAEMSALLRDSTKRQPPSKTHRWTWLLHDALGRTTHNQTQSTVSDLSGCDSPADISTSEAEELHEVQETHEARPPSLGLLPSELILLISELLPAADAVCLALTCKRMCYISNIRYLARLLDSDATESLLCRLESETTGVSYCIIDQRLARFFATDTTYKLIGLQLHLHKDFRTRRPPSVRFQGSLFNLPYCTARLVTNHQILGPHHGLPASSLARVYDHCWRDHGVCWKEAWTANLIHGELFLSCTHEFIHESADAGKLQTYFSTKSIGICSHVEIARGRNDLAHVGFPINMIGNTKYHDMGWCQKCETDWETSIEWKDPEHGWTVILRTYHGLGTCRSPNDRKWQAISSDWQSESKPYRGLPPGAVKSSWEEFGNHFSINQL